VSSDRYSNENERLRLLLKEYRKASALTQEELASRLEVPQSWISKVESGERILSFVEVLKLCAALGVSIRELATQFEQRENESK
jgi:transcriptional regulator with XRE-family HTH domain